MTADEQACMDVANALAVLAASARGGAGRDLHDAVTPGTHGVAALVGAIILMARASEKSIEVIDVAIDALRLAQRTIQADQSRKDRESWRSR